MSEGRAGIPATGEFAKLINFIYKQADKLAKEGDYRYKYASVGDIYSKKGK